MTLLIHLLMRLTTMFERGTVVESSLDLQAVSEEMAPNEAESE